MGTPRGFLSIMQLWALKVEVWLRNHPEYAAPGNDIVGYFYFLADQGYIQEPDAERIAYWLKQRNFPGPEIYRRNAQQLRESGRIHVNAQQKHLALSQAEETREFFEH